MDDVINDDDDEDDDDESSKDWRTGYARGTSTHTRHTRDSAVADTIEDTMPPEDIAALGFVAAMACRVERINGVVWSSREREGRMSRRRRAMSACVS